MGGHSRATLKHFVGLLFLVAVAAAAQGTEWNQKVRTGDRLRDLGQYVQAEAAFQAAADQAELFRAPDPRLATSLNGLASVYQLRGQYAQAEQLYRRAIGIWEQSRGPGDPEVATGLNNLATLQFTRGSYEEAEQLLQRALEIRRQELGAGHPFVSAILANLANVQIARGRYAEAEAILRPLLASRTPDAGRNERDVAASQENLGFLYYKTGRFAEAEPLDSQLPA